MLNQNDLLEVEKEYCLRSLSGFIESAWHVLEPSNEYVHGWHVDALSEHLEAVETGEITRLLINIPPGTMKSLATSVFFPAWLWARGHQHYRIIGASYEEGLATRDNLKTRRLVESEWYQSLFPLQLTSDQNQKTYFENSKSGFRQSCAVKSMTGRRGDIIIWDDPHSVEMAESEEQRLTTLRVFRETLPTRLISPKKSAIIVIMQRLHEKDVSGYIMANDLGYTHLMLPMEFEPERKCITQIGWEDPRKEDGELLFPERFPKDVIDRDKKVMGSYAAAGQFQQRPAPRKGGFFAWDKIVPVRRPPEKIMDVVRYWDKAGSEDSGKYTAGVKIGKMESGAYLIMDVQRGQWSYLKRENVIKQTAEMDGVNCNIWVEQEPGSGGKESAQRTASMLSGYTVHLDRVQDSKVNRANPFASQVEAGNVYMIVADWNQEFLDELKGFPSSEYRDQVDAASAGFLKLQDVNILDKWKALNG
jgi:predicted phage terminase large subunit-like protein